MKLIAIFISLLSLASAASARELSIEYYDQLLQGEATLYLQRELQNQYPWERLERLSLRSVRLEAKSRNGQANAILYVNSQDMGRARIPGNPNDFLINEPWSYNSIYFENYNYNDRGPWQIYIRGNVKVKRVVLYVEEDYYRPEPPPRPAPPRPAPPRPQPPRNEVVRLMCKSDDEAYAECRHPSIRRVQSVRVVDQLSRNWCQDGHSFGALHDGVWVSRGCRAIFEIVGTSY